MLPACPPSDLSFTPVICVSASKVISPEHHREHHSWVYLQGAGDDEEHWSSGLTPETFWENAERLVELAEGGDRSGFEGAVAALLTGNKKSSSNSGSSSSNPATDSLENQSRPHDESAGVTMSTGAAQVLGQSGSPGKGSLSGAGGVGEGGGNDAWLPGGQELHAVLGNTGLAVGSLAFAARNWARLGSDCSLLNLSDEPFPESLVKSLTGPARQYLHIPLKAGKKANPPRYWKTEVFPAALTFIATTIGKAPPQQQNVSPTESAQGPVSSVPSGLAAEQVVSPPSACETSVSGSVTAEDTARNAAGPVVWSSPSYKKSVSGAVTAKDTSRNAARPVVPSSARETSASASFSGEEPARNEEETAGGTGEGCHEEKEEEEKALGETIARGPDPPRSWEEPPSAAALAGRFESSSAQAASASTRGFERSFEQPAKAAELAQRVESSSARPASLPQSQRRHPRPCARSRGATGKCLVACPTGAEASVVVCLAALAAFFPPLPRSTTNDHGTPPAAREDWVPSPRQQTSATPEKCTSPENHATPENRAAPENCSTPENRAKPKSRATAETRATAAARKCETEIDKKEPGLQPEQDGLFAVLRRGAGVVTKPQLRWRFLLLQQECPWARPPRRLMQELNEYFMSPGQHSWWSLSDRLLLLEGSDCGEGAH